MRPRVGWRQGWANLRCAFTGHLWVHQGAGSWSVECSRCGDRYHVGRVVA